MQVHSPGQEGSTAVDYNQPRTSVKPSQWSDMFAWSQKILKDNTHPVTVCSPCCHLIKDTKVFLFCLCSLRNYHWHIGLTERLEHSNKVRKTRKSRQRAAGSLQIRDGNTSFLAIPVSLSVCSRLLMNLTLLHVTTSGLHDMHWCVEIILVMLGRRCAVMQNTNNL